MIIRLIYRCHDSIRVRGATPSEQGMTVTFNPDKTVMQFFHRAPQLLQLTR